MNTHSAREYTMFAPAQLCAVGVISGLATRMTFTRVEGDIEKVYYTIIPASSLTFVL